MATVAPGKKAVLHLRRSITFSLLYVEEHPEMIKKDVAPLFAIPRTTLSGILAEAVEIKTLYNESMLSSTAR